jgi:hypothetical protein
MGSELADRLRAEGWLERFTASGVRLKEAVESYRELGLEVKTVPVNQLGLNACTTCFDDPADQTMMIFTREQRDQNVRKGNRN